jgi:hypothetical protein
MKYRKKPVVIEAFQMTKERGANNVDWPAWLHHAWGMNILLREGEPPWDERRRYCIGTSEGVMVTNWNDWIIKGVKGELYPCKPDIFEATYDPVEEPNDQNKVKPSVGFHTTEKGGIMCDKKPAVTIAGDFGDSLQWKVLIQKVDNGYAITRAVDGDPDFKYTTIVEDLGDEPIIAKVLWEIVEFFAEFDNVEDIKVVNRPRP